jgi:hypothetical protein
VLSGRGLCDELITRPEESYRLLRVVVCDQETSWYEEAIARAGLQNQRKYIIIIIIISFLRHSSTANGFPQTKTAPLPYENEGKFWRLAIKQCPFVNPICNQHEHRRRFQTARRITAATRATGTMTGTVHTTIILIAILIGIIRCITHYKQSLKILKNL